MQNLETMSEVVNELISIDRKTNILAVCDNGNSRSKLIARVLSRIGYENCRVLGINSPDYDMAAKISALETADIVVCASDDVRSQLEFFINQKQITRKLTILSLGLSEKIHARSHVSLVEDEKLDDEIKAILERHGFKILEAQLSVTN